MRSIYLLSVFIISCSQAKNEFYKEKILGEQYDSKGRILKRVVTGRIPGEDIYLTITKHDTLGRVTEEYGAKPYGKKYKISLKYNIDNRIVETIDYSFPNAEQAYWFENYKSDGPYEISDTIVDFRGIPGTRSIFKHQITNELVTQREYYIDFDSVTKRQELKLLRIDTLEMNKKNELQ